MDTQDVQDSIHFPPRASAPLGYSSPSSRSIPCSPLDLPYDGLGIVLGSHDRLLEDGATYSKPSLCQRPSSVLNVLKRYTRSRPVGSLSQRSHRERGDSGHSVRDPYPTPLRPSVSIRTFRI